MKLKTNEMYVSSFKVHTGGHYNFAIIKTAFFNQQKQRPNIQIDSWNFNLVADTKSINPVTAKAS